MRTDGAPWATDLDSEALDAMREARTTPNAPRHPLEADLAAKLLPYVSPWSSADRHKVALGVARTLLEMWERQHRRWQEERR